MGRNMGGLDRGLRIVVAVVLAVLAYTGRFEGGIAIGAYVVAAVFVVTSLVGFCPLYRVIGMDTCGKG
jgi:hypothetical protein